MNRKAFWIGLVSTLAAIGTHTYLAMTHFEVKFGEGLGEHSICKVGEMFDCSAVAASKYSEFMGVPMASWGLVANAIGLIINYGWVKSYGAQNIDAIVQSSVNEWLQTPAAEITPIGPIAKGADASHAKMTIVEFADFLCPHCRAALPTLNAFVDGRKDVR